MQRTFVKKQDLEEAKRIAATVQHSHLIIPVEEVATHIKKKEEERGFVIDDPMATHAVQPNSAGRLQSAAAREAPKGTKGSV